MKKFLSIKWEVIGSILLGVTTLLSWSLYENIKDWRVLVLVLIPTIMLILWIISYSQIKEFRQTVKNLW